MSYIAANPDQYAGQVVGDGQCVAFVRTASGAPATASWSQGAQAKGSAIAAGTAIATFDPNGTYGNHTDGTSHAAIYIGQDAGGLQVWDQWVGQPVHQRTIAFRGGAGKPVNDGDAFYVIE
jgi:hypothetical protein